MFIGACIYLFELTHGWSCRPAFFDVIRRIVEAKVDQVITDRSTCSPVVIKRQTAHSLQLESNYLRYLLLLRTASENKVLVSPRYLSAVVNLSILFHEKVEVSIFASRSIRNYGYIEIWFRIEYKNVCTRRRCSRSGYQSCSRSCRRYSCSWTNILGTWAACWTIWLTWTL